MNHVDAKRSSVRRPRVGAVLGRAAVAGGLVAVGAAFGVLLGLPTAEPARAGEQNYVRSASHEAVAAVRLDEEVAILFNSALLPSSVGPDTVLVRTGPTQGEQANGQFVIGRFMYDRSTQRRVVIRPEAVQEYYQLIKGMSRADATAAAARLIDRIQTTGRFSQLRGVDRALRNFFGPTYGAGTRLDDETVFAIYPAPLNPGDPLQPYRERVAGDDALWQDYLVNANYGAFSSLQQNPEYERFYHRVDPATGITESQSVLRGRTYRQVLIDRRTAKRVMFVPDVPIRADLTDTGYKPGVAYSIVVPASQPGVFNTVLTRKGHRPLLQAEGRDFSTYFTTIPGTVISSGLFLDNEARAGIGTLQKPRVITYTPPNGETYVDPTTDWEDPDNQGTTPVSARKTFTYRVRLAQPVDPRTITPVNLTMRKTRTNPGTPSETAQDVPIAVGTFLTQHRLGKVEIEITPATNLDPNSEYEVAINGLIKSLGGELLNITQKATFITGAADPPLDAIRENFLTAQNRASPSNPDTAGQISTAYWPAPQIYDPQLSGRCLASFMPFSGTGVGARRDPVDPGAPVVQDLQIDPGEQITFVTEDLDPASPNYGNQIEYHYGSVTMNTASVVTLGRHPLVIRSQGDVSFTSTNILIGGKWGGDGLTNADTVNGEPTGGLGGQPGPGGYRGGDGANAPLVDPITLVIIRDAQGRMQFDQTNLEGRDGQPGYRVNGLVAGGGRGGFSGDRDYPAYDADLNGVVDGNDNLIMPERVREAGGGAGHSSAGSPGDGAGSSLQTDVNGDPGGLGGGTYGDADMTDAPLNAQGVPTLAFGSGGSGGGGGGAEQDGSTTTNDASDAGGGGGGGGGGAIQICARGNIKIDSSQIDARGGRGGRTYNANRTSTGEGAPGGCGSGGTIWLQAYEGDVSIVNGSQVLANSVLNTSGADGGAIGQITTGLADTPSSPSPVTGRGGNGGNGYVRIEDQDGTVLNLGAQVQGDLTLVQFRPELDGSYPGRTSDVPMVVNQSVAYSRWFNSLLDTPTYVGVFDDPLTPEIEGTAIFDFASEVNGTVLIECRSAPDDENNTGHPNLFRATGWVQMDPNDPSSLSAISDRRYLQFRVTFQLPLSYQFRDALLNANPIPYVDFLQINIELQ